MGNSPRRRGAAEPQPKERKVQPRMNANQREFQKEIRIMITIKIRKSCVAKSFSEMIDSKILHHGELGEKQTS